MSDTAGDAGFDAPALRPQDWHRPRPAEVRAGPRVSRAESAAALLIAIAEAGAPGDRLGSKEELRARCEVSAGTFNEAMRIAQSRGIVSVRPGPGGGVFAAEQSPMVRLGNSVLALDADQTPVGEAVRIRDALDPLLIEDALWHASPADLADLRAILTGMSAAVKESDPVRFIHANWALHARIAAASPHAVLRSLYVNLLDQIESHTLAVLSADEQLLPDYLASRYAVHAALVDALDHRDRSRALALIAEHNAGSTLVGSEAGRLVDSGQVPAGVVARSGAPAALVELGPLDRQAR